MIDYMILLILILALTQHGDGKMAALIYALICGSHSVMFSSLEGSAYFISAATSDALIVAVLCYRVPVSRVSDLLISISLIFGAVNSAGWLVWWVGGPIEIYYNACVTLYILTILSLLRKDGALECGTNIINTCFRYLGRPGFALRSFLRQATG